MPSESDCIMLCACFGLQQAALFWEPSAAPGSMAWLVDVGRRGGPGWQNLHPWLPGPERGKQSLPLCFATPHPPRWTETLTQWAWTHPPFSCSCWVFSHWDANVTNIIDDSNALCPKKLERFWKWKNWGVLVDYLVFKTKQPLQYENITDSPLVDTFFFMY